ncbi:zinc-dependent alcohol dehydrogenase [Haloglycomyces albus]|uniref:zinc-dependent alcohol dehydrogenase n=1 Tax=Haloglycomyces albus TaxID=526067 RepID=UPI00054FEE5F|nr:zinc-binding dehydrogenase [Haloglycomyces albus]
MTTDVSLGRWKVTADEITWESQKKPPIAHPGTRTVRVIHCGICGSDLAKLSARPYRAHSSGAWTPGHEMVIEDLNGQPAAVNPLIPCQRCTHCSHGDIHLCPGLKRIGWDYPGGFATHINIPDSNIVPLPYELTDIAVLADTLATAIHSLHCARSRANTKSIAIIGTGPLAVATVAVAHLQGWSTVAVVGRHRERLDTINPLVGAELALTGMLPTGAFDLVVDAASGTSTQPLEEALRIIRPGGEIVVLNAYQPGLQLNTPLRSVFSRSITLTGSYSHCRNHGSDFLHALRLLQKHPQWANKLMTHRLAMSELPRALSGHASKPSIKTVLTNEGNQ